MAPRPIWQGHLRLSLVNCPVALYSAISRTSDVSFHMIHKKTGNRIRMIPHDPELGEVERKDLVRGFEIRPDEYVVLSNEEIQNVRLETTKSIDIEEFVDAGEIDRIYWNAPYYLVPNGEAGLEAYLVIQEAMEEMGKVGLGRLVLYQRERIVALEPRGKGMLLTTLRSHDEIRSEKELFDEIPKKKNDKKMLEIADKLIEQRAADFDPTHFQDRYEDALRQLIKEKQKGKGTVVAAAPEKQENVVDLMDALRKSLQKDGGAGRERAERFMRAREPAKAETRREPKAKARRKTPARRKAS